MKDEEMAEEYAKKQNLQNVNPSGIVRSKIADAFLAGLKVGKPQYHDLLKNPNDVPKDNDEKLCFYGKGKVVARYDSDYGCWVTTYNNLETLIPSRLIVAWCETPNF